MVRLYDKDTQALLGTISEPQLQFLIDQLEEEASDDQDYYINRATVEMLATAGADPALLDVLQRSLGDREDMEIRWEQ
jgi:processive 1,2-diacylglycerol beta-glucosyltransferase